MTAARRFVGERRIRFPWERRAGLRSLLMLGRVGPVLVVIGVLGTIAILGVRERHSAGVRQTRATLIGVRHAIDAFRADNGGSCPSGLDKLTSYGNFKEAPTDASARVIAKERPTSSRATVLTANRADWTA